MISKKDLKFKELSVNELSSMFKIIVATNKINLKELSEKSGCAYTYLVALLNGNISNPTYKTLNNIATELGFNLRFNLSKINNEKQNLQKGDKI